MKILRLLAAVCFCTWLSAPASADTVGTFTLDGVTFSDASTATGQFDLDLTTGTLSNVNVTTNAANYFFGNFSNGPASFNLSAPDSPYSGYGLTLNLLVTLTPANMVNGASFSLNTGTSYEGYFDFFECFIFACTSRGITAGQLDVSNVTSATPLPAALPLFATGLGAVGALTWRRKRKARTA